MATQQRAVRTRATIIDAAARVFARRGYEAAALSELIAESGLTKGAFYFHFSSKQDLALETMRHKQQQLIDAIAADVPAEATGTDRLVALLRARARALEADESLWCVLRLGSELGSASAPSSEYSKLNEGPIELLAQLIDEGQEAGTIRDELDPRDTGELVFASVIGMDSLALQLTGGADLPARTERLLDLLRAGLESRSTNTRPRRSQR